MLFSWCSIKGETLATTVERLQYMSSSHLDMCSSASVRERTAGRQVGQPWHQTRPASSFLPSERDLHHSHLETGRQQPHLLFLCLHQRDLHQFHLEAGSRQVDLGIGQGQTRPPQILQCNWGSSIADINALFSIVSPITTFCILQLFFDLKEQKLNLDHLCLQANFLSGIPEYYCGEAKLNSADPPPGSLILQAKLNSADRQPGRQILPRGADPPLLGRQNWTQLILHRGASWSRSVQCSSHGRLRFMLSTHTSISYFVSLF